MPSTKEALHRKEALPQPRNIGGINMPHLGDIPTPTHNAMLSKIVKLLRRAKRRIILSWL
jgi:hypothetical protein